MSRPEVFIIESLDVQDERDESFEGRILSNILALSGKQCEYRYIRTARELVTMLEQFSASSYRYLHFSCHGSKGHLHTTLDPIPFREFSNMVRPHLMGRRLFLSACSVTNRNLAENVMPGSGCFSILGPDEDILFSDAAVLWASFYHVMFRKDSAAMKYDTVRAKAQEVADMYRVRMTLIDHKKIGDKDYRLEKIRPRREADIVCK